MTPDDMTLVREFAARQSETAFAALVQRHIGLVHSAAFRQTGDAHLAEEITQAVFIVLARKAASLGADTILPAWLYRATRYAAADALKLQRRRREREQEAYMQSTLQTDDTTATWQQMSPLLDDAMADLPERDRAPLVLRYFENRPWQEVAAVMRVKEDAAQKRVGRALDKLRKFFTKRGLTLSAAGIAGAVAANSVQAAPAGLVGTVSTISVAKGAVASASTKTIVTGVLKTMAWAKAQTILIIGAVVMLGLTGGVVVTHELAASRPVLRITGTGQIVLFTDPPETVQTAQFTILTDGSSYRISMNSKGAGNVEHDVYDCHADYASDGTDLFILSDRNSFFNRKPGGLAGFAYPGRELGQGEFISLTGQAIWLAYCSADYFSATNNQRGFVLEDGMSFVWPDFVTNQVHYRTGSTIIESIAGRSRNEISQPRTDSSQPIRMVRLKQYPGGFEAWKFIASNFTNIGKAVVPLTLEMATFYPKMSETNLESDDTIPLRKATFHVDMVRIEHVAFNPMPPVATNELKIEDWRFKDIAGNFIVESHATRSGWPVRGSQGFVQAEALARKLVQDGPPVTHDKPQVIEAP